MARQAYTCCDVAADVPLEAPCWVCGQVGYSIDLDAMKDLHPWHKPWHLPKQSADDSYV